MEKPSFSRATWLIIVIASIGFLFDTYELLMTPLTAPPAIAELLDVPLNNPLVTSWTGKLLWYTALCGGVFGLIGGWLTDRFGRKTVMAASIFVYSLSPMAAAYSTSLGAFIFFRCTTFIGVCVEFIAAITWLSEVFEDRKMREKWLGITQAFASVGGIVVTAMSALILANYLQFPTWGLPNAPGGGHPSNWRYLLMTGFLPAIPIALLLPFVPESRVWKERRASGTLRRPSIGALFSPELRRITLLTAVLSACAYGIAFGALQLTPLRIAPGLPELSEQSKALGPLRTQGEALNIKLNELKVPHDSPERAALLAQIKENRAKQGPLEKVVKEKGNEVQFYQEMGGLAGRIALAVLIIAGLGRRLILRLFQIPALPLLAVTYLSLFYNGGASFMWAYALCGFFTIAQFSYFGEYLPKVFPLHLRGTGGSFATNVGGRMVGTSAAFLTTSLVAPMLAGSGKLLPVHVATAAGYVATGLALIALIFGMMLPEPPKEVDAVSKPSDQLPAD